MFLDDDEQAHARQRPSVAVKCRKCGNGLGNIGIGLEVHCGKCRVFTVAREPRKKRRTNDGQSR